MKIKPVKKCPDETCKEVLFNGHHLKFQKVEGKWVVATPDNPFNGLPLRVVRIFYRVAVFQRAEVEQLWTDGKLSKFRGLGFESVGDICQWLGHPRPVRPQYIKCTCCQGTGWVEKGAENP